MTKPIETLAQAVADRYTREGLAPTLDMLGALMKADAGKRTPNKNPAWAEVPKQSLITIGDMLITLAGSPEVNDVAPLRVLAGMSAEGVTWKCAGCGSPQEISGVQRCPECAPAGVPPTAAMLLDGPMPTVTIERRTVEQAPACPADGTCPEHCNGCGTDAPESNVFAFTYLPPDFSELLADPAPWSEPMAPQGEQAAIEVSDPDPKY